MTFRDLVKQYNIRQTKTLKKKNLIARNLLTEYAKDHELLHSITDCCMEDLLYNYFLLASDDKKDLIDIMKKKGFNYVESIRNAIYYLLGRKEELEEEDELYINPLLWPGVDSIQCEDDTYILNTILGTVRVSKVSDIFKNTSSSYIFRKPLMGKCYERSYDFIKENPKDYQVVLSYEPYFFKGGIFHTYLESDTAILDIAANAYYSKEDDRKLLCGTIIKKLDYKVVEKQYKILSRRIPEIKENNNPKLLMLSLYYDYQNKN